MTRNSIAASVRRNKEKHPELYCQARGCLWRGRLCTKVGHWRLNGFASLEERIAEFQRSLALKMSIDAPPFGSDEVNG